jgi:hypothetical protein
MIRILADHDGKRFYDFGRLVLFEDGFGLELLNALRLEGVECAPMPIFCEHCSMWLTQAHPSYFEDSSVPIYFCHCIGLHHLTVKPLNQQHWYSLRAEARELLCQYHCHLNLAISTFSEGQVSEERVLKYLYRLGLDQETRSLRQIAPQWVPMLRKDSDQIINKIRSQQS